MEFQIDQFRRLGGKVFSSSDGHKYLCHKSKGNILYLRCVLYKKGCKASAKLDKEVNLLYPKSVHDHELQEYHTDVNLIKTKCKRIAQTSQHNLREIFNDITRSDPSGTQVTFKECESSMFRARKLLQPKIPASASEFCQQLPETSFALHLKATITLENRIAIIFFSDHIYEFVNDISSIQFDGTFQTVPKQFYQLWTVFSIIWKTFHSRNTLFVNK